MRKIIIFLSVIELLLILTFVVVPEFVFAQDCPVDRVCLKNPLKFGSIEYKTPGELVAKAFQGFAAMLGVFAIAWTVFSGFKLIIATNEEAIKSARESITWSVGGFAISLLAFTVISGVSRLLGFTPSQIDLGKDEIKNPILLPGDTSGLRSGQFAEVMIFFMVNLLGLAGFATILMIIYYGFKYITAAGNEEAIEQAKTGLKWSILGFVITILAYTIISSVQRFLLQGPPT